MSTHECSTRSRSSVIILSSDHERIMNSMTLPHKGSSATAEQEIENEAATAPSAWEVLLNTETMLRKAR